MHATFGCMKQLEFALLVLFASNSLKTSVLFDNNVKSGKMCSVACQSWCQSSWKNFKTYAQDGSEQELGFRQDWKLGSWDLSNFI